jgi:putative two-component system response regulator
MSKKRKFMQKILIVDDSEMNRIILSEMLSDEYEVMEAEDGAQALAILEQHNMEISLVLLDIVMPNMDGYEVLDVMNEKHWIEGVPVIMISAENSPSNVARAYELGVADFISRPFDTLIVRRRVANVVMLYARQKYLTELVADQIYEKEKSNSLMISILGHIVEFRNGESGLHVAHVQVFTEVLLRRLLKMTDKYKLSNADISLISTAAALHDIGKISIPDHILNKPGRLTTEEFEIMKTHSAVGADMIDALKQYQQEPLIKFAYEICRWHHERYNGSGYPDGLKGDEIPLSAQVVSMADVYDALTSERVYKKAYTHETSMKMIMNGECGVFNPLLLECLQASAEEIQNEFKISSVLNGRQVHTKGLVEELLRDRMKMDDEIPGYGGRNQ